MLIEEVKKQIIEGMKAKDELKVSTLKMLSSALHNAEIDKRGELTHEEEVKIVQSEAKKRKDAIEALKQAQGKQTTSDPESLKLKLEKEEAELVMLSAYLPTQLTSLDIAKFVDEAITQTGAKGISDMGQVMGAVMKELSGKADGQEVSRIVKEKLS